MTRYTPQWIQAGDYAANADRRLIGALWPRAAVTGMVVTPASGMTVNISAGTAAIPTSNNTGAVLCASDAVEQVTLAAAPPSGQNRYDVVVAQARATDVDSGANNDWLFTVVQGSAAASPTVPNTPANAVAVAQIYVPGASVTVTAPNVTDARPSRLDQPWNTSWGIVGIARVTAAQTGITTGQTDITGLSVTWQVLANRRYRVELEIPMWTQNTAAGAIQLYLKDDLNQVRNSTRMNAYGPGTVPPAHVTHWLDPNTPVLRTYRAAASTSAGTLDINASATQYPVLIVTDSGPVPGTAGTLLDELVDRDRVDTQPATEPEPKASEQ